MTLLKKILLPSLSAAFDIISFPLKQFSSLISHDVTLCSFASHFQSIFLVHSPLRAIWCQNPQRIMLAPFLPYPELSPWLIAPIPKVPQSATYQWLLLLSPAWTGPLNFTLISYCLLNTATCKSQRDLKNNLSQRALAPPSQTWSLATVSCLSERHHQYSMPHARNKGSILITFLFLLHHFQSTTHPVLASSWIHPFMSISSIMTLVQTIPPLTWTWAAPPSWFYCISCLSSPFSKHSKSDLFNSQVWSYCSLFKIIPWLPITLWMKVKCVEHRLQGLARSGLSNPELFSQGQLSKMHSHRVKGSRDSG